MPKRSNHSEKPNRPQEQVVKFRELAREIGADTDEATFKAKLVKVAKAPRSPTKAPKP